MASSSTKKRCANGDGCKQAAVTKCEGCSKDFCLKHMNDHRRILDEEMNIIIDEHDHLKNTLNQQSTKPDSHPLIKEINNWEKESIEKIQTRAQDLRQELFQLTIAHADNLSKKLRQLSGQLKHGREHDDFLEIDLQLWKKTLNDLKTSLTSPATITINRRDDVSLVQNISVDFYVVTKESFERVSDNQVRVEENEQVVIRDTSSFSLTEVRGKGEYRLGCHEVRLHIEQLTGDWIFLGINSKSTPLQDRSHESKSAYGWSSNNCICSNGSNHSNNLNSIIEMKMSDVIDLIFDCDSRTISMINERTKRKHELIVSVVECPLPWQLHIVLYHGHSRVRILSDYITPVDTYIS